MRRPLIAGNWKMHFTVPEGLEFALRLRHALEPFAGREDIVVLPPALMLWEIANVLRGCPIEVGAQNASWEDQGPFTGEISPKMLAGWCHYLLIGHSERRQLFSETDEQLNRKLQAAFRNSLKGILAPGETLEEHELGRTQEVITRRVNAAPGRPLVLVIIDGWGYRTDPFGNAIAAAKKPNWDALWQRWPHTILAAAGEPVGLPKGQQGNSEVGHLNIGAGRVVYQDLTRINRP